MSEPTFDYHRIVGRKDILSFIYERLNKKVYEGLGNNPERWIEEITIVSNIMTGKPLVCSEGLLSPPLEDSTIQKLGDNVYLYRGDMSRLTGIYIGKERNYDNSIPEKSTPRMQWCHYTINNKGVIAINQQFNFIKPEDLRPENFEQKGELVKKGKRDIRKLIIETPEKNLVVYAKESASSLGFFYQPPSYRLTNISGLCKVSSLDEMKNSIELESLGVNIPNIIGYYQTPLEEFLFLEEVEGKDPREYLDTHKNEIIIQDAKMLSALCRLGLRKQGFYSFDDKIFDGEKLFLIDTEEIVDLYFYEKVDFKELLLDPLTVNLEDFKEHQRCIFKRTLRDALFEYRNTLTTTKEDKFLYIKTFFEGVGFQEPKDEELEKIIEIPEDHTTYDTYISLMLDTD